MHKQNNEEVTKKERTMSVIENDRARENEKAKIIASIEDKSP